MGVQGAAIATVISQFVTNIFYFQFVLRKKSYLVYSLRNFQPDLLMLREIFKIGLPGFFFQFLASFAIGYTNYQASSFGGDTMVAAMGIMLRVMALGSYVVFGFSKGYQPVVGANFGARQHKRVHTAIRTTLLWLTAFCVIFGLSVAFFSRSIALAFSGNSVKAAAMASYALLLNGAVFVGFGIQNAYSHAFLALGRGKESFLLNTARQGIFFIPAMYALPKIFGASGIIWAQPIADLLTVALTLILVVRASRELPLLDDFTGPSNLKGAEAKRQTV